MADGYGYNGGNGGPVLPPTGNYIRLVRRSTPGPPGHTMAYRLEILVEAEGVDPEIFMYTRQPLDPATNTTGDRFIHIATPTDLEEYPTGLPDPTTRFPFFRLASVDLIFRSLDQLEETWDGIVDDVTKLTEALALLQLLSAEEMVTINF